MQVPMPHEHSRGFQVTPQDPHSATAGEFDPKAEAPAGREQMVSSGTNRATHRSKPTTPFSSLPLYLGRACRCLRTMCLGRHSRNAMFLVLGEGSG